MSSRKSSYENDSVYSYSTRSSNDNDSNMDLLEDDNSDLSEVITYIKRITHKIYIYFVLIINTYNLGGFK